MPAKKKVKSKQQEGTCATPPPAALREPVVPVVFANHERILLRYPEIRRLFLEYLARYGNQSAAAAYVKVSLQTIEDFRKKHTWFAEQWEAAQLAHKALIEKTIHQRAIDGWLEPKFGKFGIQGYVRKFSDQLLIAYARRHVPEYREGDVTRQTVEGSVEHRHTVNPKELTPEQREALRLLLGDPDEPQKEEIKQITVEVSTPVPSTNGVHLNGTNGVHKNGAVEDE